MNLAFGTVLIFLILIPGILFRLGYFSLPFSKNYFKSNPLDDIAWSIIPAILIQCVGVAMVNTCSTYFINFETLGILLTGHKETTTVSLAFKSVGNNIIPILFYNCSLALSGLVIGHLAKKVVRFCKLDKRIQYLRFSNEWYYILSGEILDFPKVLGESKEVDFVFIDALVGNGGNPTIYVGLLAEYFLNKDGGLDSICLYEVKRRKLADDPKSENNEEKYYQIPGNLMVIPFSTILNLNISYYSLDDFDEGFMEDSESNLN